MSVAVIIPNLNNGLYLDRCLAFAYRQTVPAAEVVLVDGESTDTSREIASRWGARWISAPPRGTANARNIGIRAASAEFIVPLDSDDWIAPNYIERCLPEMADAAVGVVAPALQWPDGRVQYPVEPITIETLWDAACRPINRQQNRLFACSMFRRAVWEQVGGYDEGPCYEDLEFWLRVVAAGWKVAVVREPLIHYCPPATSACRTMTPARHEALMSHIRGKHAGLVHA